MATGRADYTTATDITAQTLSSLSVDIAVQSLGNLNIDIAAVSVGNLNIDLAEASIGNLNIDIAEASVGNLNIDIAAASVGNLGVDIAAASVGDLNIDINAQTIGNLNIDLAAQTADRISTISQAPTGTTTIFKSGQANNSTVVIHTVTAGKTFYLTGGTIQGSTGNNNQEISIAVRNASDVIQYYVFRQVFVLANEALTGALSLPPVPPQDIAAGWDIVVIASASMKGNASIGGWEE